MPVVHATQRIAPYITILGALNIKYTSRASVKGQILTDLAAKTTKPLPDEMTKAQNDLAAWDPLSRMVHVDGITNQR